MGTSPGSALAALLVPAVLLLAGCSSDDGLGHRRPSRRLASQFVGEATVAGDYDTAVELLESTCDGIEVVDNETGVEQEGDSVTLVHAGISYVGPLRDDGSFATASVPVTVGSDTHSLAVTGTFGDDGFEAQVVAAVTGSQTCGYTVGWTGTKQ